MRYQPHTEDEIRSMLEVVGVGDIDALFEPIPAALRLDRELAIPAALDEYRLLARAARLAGENAIDDLDGSFLGGGIYEHFVPSVVDQILLRGEFLTSYTPYQSEVTQGTLKSIFEYQTMMAEVLGFDLANASMYDGAHATVEGALMALRLKRKRNRVLVANTTHPHYREVIQTYLGHIEPEYVEVGDLNGRVDMAALAALDTSDVAALVVQSPNFFGIVEDVSALAAFCHGRDMLLVSSFSEPVAFGLFAPPGDVGADIACGEGQSFGIAPGLGGPVCGVFACRQDYLRTTPGRLVSQTVDAEGRESYALTLATREQHIRRARATSNICTNQGLMALASTIYLSLLGKAGLTELAQTNFANAEYLKAALCALPGVTLAFPGQPTFNEFVVELPVAGKTAVQACSAAGIMPGLDLARPLGDAFENRLLVCATELHDKDLMDRLVALVADL